MRNVIFLTLTFAITLFIFFSFRPVKIIDHQKSEVICHKNNIAYNLGPNLIIALNDKLDPVTDSKIKKLCEYSIINDTNNIYQIPDSPNYSVSAVYKQAGSWTDAILLGITVFILLYVIFNGAVQFKFTTYLFAFPLSLLIFIIFLLNVAKQIYCQRLTGSTLNNFRISAYGFGSQRLQQEEILLKEALIDNLKQCKNQ
ncbi:hypothetical protein A2774_04965 [Candidatus Roizmanbacteria bacterium RIFCSPHIGHO2_01_FULL_39_12c]|uniref:Uncharacterized protein n=1 Tax=Candidatus Roizmanbacteria bacterium RIFCSPHIGHO2_01_FULL_39_12c TaxID=1802031 RepID=A0A1F7GBB6_9BACT|nr:MAG: hypothetical protein A2774_04965 [Candidatus Roizmanbacteria bacterium RIFCSPHIGHO2_01_FULL_39_12c]